MVKVCQRCIKVKLVTLQVNGSKGFRDCESFFNLITYDTEQHLYLLISTSRTQGGQKVDNNNNNDQQQATSFFLFSLHLIA